MASTPRQIAQDVIQSLAKLTADTPALRKPYRELHEAFLLEKSMPPCVRAPFDGWPLIEHAAQYAADVMARARAGDTAGAWRAAAEASYWHGAAEALLRPEALKLLARARSFRDVGIRNVSGANQKRREAAEVEALKDFDTWRSSSTRRAALEDLSRADQARKYLSVSRRRIPRRQAARLRAMLKAGRIK